MSSFPAPGGLFTLIHEGIGLENLICRPVWSGRVPAADEWSVAVAVEPRERGAVVRARLKNNGRETLRVARLRWSSSLDVSPVKPGLRFPRADRPLLFCSENFRGDFLMIASVLGSGYFVPLAEARTEIGWSEDQVFPGLFIASQARPAGFLAVAASEERFHPIFRLRGGNLADGDRWIFELDETPAGAEFVSLEPGAELSGEAWYFGVPATSDVQDALGDYYAALRQRGVFQRLDKNPLARQRIYCSWNFDFFEKIDEESLLAQAPLLRRHFPSVGFLQLDAGYQRPQGEGRAMIDFLYGDEEPFDRAKFPSGGKVLADRIRETGLRPAIWMGLWAGLGGRMMREHPEWLALDETGRVLKFDRWWGGMGVLDPSVPGVREYLERVCRIVFSEWKYEGLKLDFSTFAFDHRRVRYRFGGTASEHRDWLVRLVRRYLPEDGFFGWCIVAGTGNPLRAVPGADYFRCAEDVDVGSWDRVRQIAMWTANTQLGMPGRPVLPNIDSIGYGQQLDEVQNQTWFDLAAVTGMALEVSGDLRRHDEKKLARLERCLQLSDPHAHATILDVPLGETSVAPGLWLSRNAARTLLGVFNWTGRKARIDLAPLAARLGQVPPRARNAWDGSPVELAAGLDLPACGSLLLELSR